MRKLFLSGMVLLLAASLLAAGGKGEGAGAVKGKITVWGCFTELQKPLENAVKIFTAENPEAKMEVLVFDLRDFEAKVAATAPMGQAADIIIMDHSLTARYAKAKILSEAPADIEKLVKTPGRYLAIAPEKVSYQGKVVGMPFFGGGPGLFYNTDYLAEAGLKGAPKTVDELAAYAVKLRKTDAAGKLTRSGYSVRLTGPTGGSQKWAFISNQMLGQDFIVEGKSPGTYRANLDNEESARALQWHLKLLHGPDKSDDWALKHDAEGFAAGEVAMFLREPWVIPFLKDKSPDIKYQAAYQPRDRHWRIYDWQVNACLPASGKQKAAAWKFVEVMQRKEVMEVLFKDSGWIPSRRDIVFNEIMSQEPRFKVFFDIPKEAQIYFEMDASSYTEIWTRVGEVIQAAYREAGLADERNLSGCREVVKKAHDVANEILKSNNELGN